MNACYLKLTAAFAVVRDVCLAGCMGVCHVCVLCRNG